MGFGLGFGLELGLGLVEALEKHLTECIRLGCGARLAQLLRSESLLG